LTRSISCAKLNKNTDNTPLPCTRQIESLKDIEITQVAAGQHHSICVDSTGRKLFGFGRSCSGQLGICVDSEGRKLFGFGRSSSGQLGHVTQSVPPPAGSHEVNAVPIYLEYDASGKPMENPIITQISCGGNHTFALTENGDVYSWGYGFNGALGVGKIGKDDCVFLPKQIDVTHGINAVRDADGLGPVRATVSMMAGGGQHSAIVATLQEE